jgi:hypothetical protein
VDTRATSPDPDRWIEAKTAGNHVEHIYTKIGTSNRAGASLFAMQHGLLPEDRFPNVD